MVVSPGFAEPTVHFASFVEDCSHFFLCCKTFKANFSSLWQNLFSKILLLSPTYDTVLFVLGRLPLPFELKASIMIRRFVSSAVGKICKIRTDKLRELVAPWLADFCNFCN